MAETSPSRVSYDFVTRAIARTLGTPGKGYYALLALAVALLGVGIVCLLFLLRYGLGLAGYSHPVYWAVYITCFVFWVGIAHSGTLISAILFLFRSGWRTAVYRTAEAPARAEQEEDRRDQRARVRDAHPEHEAGNVDGPVHRVRIAREPQPVAQQEQQAHDSDREQRHRQGEQREVPLPRIAQGARDGAGNDVVRDARRRRVGHRLSPPPRRRARPSRDRKSV